MGYYVYKYVHPLHPWLYVGKCNSNLKDRLDKHLSDPSDNIPRKYKKLLEESNIFYLELNTEDETRAIESYLINTFKPMLNTRSGSVERLNSVTVYQILNRTNWQRFDEKNNPAKFVNLSWRFITTTNYVFTLSEQRTFMYILGLLNNPSTQLNGYVGRLPIRFNVNDYFNNVITSRGGNSRRVAVNALYGLASKKITFKKTTGEFSNFIGVLDGIRLDGNTVIITLNPQFAAFCNLQHTVRYNATLVSQFNCKYSPRIYEFLLANRERGDQHWTADSYGIGIHANDLSDNVKKELQKAVNEINEKSDIYVELRLNYFVYFACFEKNRLSLDNAEVK